MALRLDLDIGDLVLIDNGRVQVRALEKSGRRSRLEFIADRSIPIRQIRQQPTQEEEPLPEQEELP